MTTSHASLVVSGQVVVAARHDGLETAEAVGIADGRVVSAGSRADVLDAAAPGAQVIDAGPVAVVPGLHDFHLHLVGMARARLELRLDDATEFGDLVGLVRAAAAPLPPDGWLRGRGWKEAALEVGELDQLEAAVGGRPALLYSHDAHSSWASAAALRRAGVDAQTADPAGGRIERGASGAPNGVLREAATDLLDGVALSLSGPALDRALEEVLAELAGWGVTGATDAGDTSAEAGIGRYAALGDRASTLLDASERLDGRLRLTVNLPAEAIEAGAALGMRTGAPISGTATLRAGWAKAYADGALGSHTAALFTPYTCGPTPDRGILRLGPDELDQLLRTGQSHRIGLAVHAIGDRAVATVLDAIEQGPARDATVPPHRIEHLQLVRPNDVPRLSALDVTASLQPIHAASDRVLVEACWDGRQDDAYPTRALAAAGTRLAFGSDAPVESPNPWQGIYAAVHRRFPGEEGPDWRPQHALDPAGSLAAYTTGPAVAIGAGDEGTLRPGCHADLAVLNVDLATLLVAGGEMASARAVVTLVGGTEVYRA